MDERGYATGRARRAAIPDTTMAVFGEVGYRGASLRDIAARCGITHPGLKHHFPTKDALLLAVLVRRDQSAQEVIDSGGATGAEELHRLIKVVAGNATQPEIIELFTTLSAEAASSGHPAHTYFADRYRRVVAQLTVAYQAARDQGTLRADFEPEAAARELVALMDGLQVQWLYDPQAVDMAGILAAHPRQALRLHLCRPRRVRPQGLHPIPQGLLRLVPAGDHQQRPAPLVGQVRGTARGVHMSYLTSISAAPRSSTQ